MLQLYNFFIFIILGMLVAFIFDFFRALRKTFKTNDVITYIEDILFWIISGFLIMSSIFKFNDGEIRFYLFVGLLLGIFIYIILLTKLINKILEILMKPIKGVLNIIISIFKRFYNFINNYLKKCKNKSKKIYTKK